MLSSARIKSCLGYLALEKGGRLIPLSPDCSCPYDRRRHRAASTNDRPDDLRIHPALGFLWDKRHI
jgi:hypothetical protein